MNIERASYKNTDRQYLSDPTSLEIKKTTNVAGLLVHLHHPFTALFRPTTAIPVLTSRVDEAEQG